MLQILLTMGAVFVGYAYGVYHTRKVMRDVFDQIAKGGDKQHDGRRK